MSRRRAGLGIALYRTRNTGTNRARQVLVCESAQQDGVGAHNAGPTWDAHVTITLKDAETGDRYFMSISAAAWNSIRDGIDGCMARNAERAS